MSEHAARVMFEEVGQRPGVETELIDVATLQIRRQSVPRIEARRPLPSARH